MLILELDHTLVAMEARVIFRKLGGQIKHGPNVVATQQTIRFRKPTRISGYLKQEKETIVK